MIKAGNYKQRYNKEKLQFMSPLTIGAIKGISNPFVGGYAFFLFIYVPDQIRALTSNLIGPDEDRLSATVVSHADRDFFDLCEKTVKEVQGIQDWTLEVTQFNGGFTGKNHAIPTVMTDSTESISLKFQELSGGVYGTPVQQWATAISDPKTGVSTLLKRDSVADYSVEAIYIVTSPNVASPSRKGRAESLEKAFFFDSMFPKNVPLSHYNYTAGSHDLTELTYEFNAEMHVGAAIDKRAMEILSSDFFYENYIVSGEKYIANRVNNNKSQLFDADNEAFDVWGDNAQDGSFIIRDDSVGESIE